MSKLPRIKKRIRKIRRVKTVDDFIEAQIEKYNEIVEENGKDIRYIG